MIPVQLFIEMRGTLLLVFLRALDLAHLLCFNAPFLFSKILREPAGFQRIITDKTYLYLTRRDDIISISMYLEK